MATNSLLLLPPRSEVSLLTPLIWAGLVASFANRMWQKWCWASSRQTFKRTGSLCCLPLGRQLPCCKEVQSIPLERGHVERSWRRKDHWEWGHMKEKWGTTADSTRAPGRWERPSWTFWPPQPPAGCSSLSDSSEYQVKQKNHLVNLQDCEKEQVIFVVNPYMAGAGGICYTAIVNWYNLQINIHANICREPCESNKTSTRKEFWIKE